MGSINIIKPLLSTTLSSSAVDDLGNINSLKKVGNAGIRTRGSWVRKRERYARMNLCRIVGKITLWGLSLEISLRPQVNIRLCD